MGSTKDIVNLISATSGVISVPPDTYLLTSPISIPPERTLDGNGSTFVVSGDAGFVLQDGSGLQRCSIQSPNPNEDRGKYGVVVHGSLCVVEDILFNGFDTCLLVEGGPLEETMLFRTPGVRAGADNVRGNRIRMWNSHRGVYAHGDECNACGFSGLYAQNVDLMVDDNSKGGAYWANCYHENGGFTGYRMRAAGQSVLVHCLSDGPIVSCEASAVLIVGGGIPVMGPHTMFTGNGLNALQVGDPDEGVQAGLISNNTANWVRSHGESSATGRFPSDVLKGNWPLGWYLDGTNENPNAVSSGIAGPRALDARRRTGAQQPFWAPHGVVMGMPPLQESTMMVVPGTRAPMQGEGTWVQGDRVLNTTPAVMAGRLLLEWVCVAGGDPGVWVAVHGTVG